MTTGSVCHDAFTPTYMNCAWAEPRILAGASVWLDGWRSRWCCLAMSDAIGTAVDVRPDQCARCPLWKARADTSDAPRDA